MVARKPVLQNRSFVNPVCKPNDGLVGNYGKTLQKFL